MYYPPVPNPCFASTDMSHICAVTGLPDFYAFSTAEEYTSWTSDAITWLEGQGISVDVCEVAVELTYIDEYVVVFDNALYHVSQWDSKYVDKRTYFLAHCMLRALQFVCRDMDAVKPPEDPESALQRARDAEEKIRKELEELEAKFKRLYGGLTNLTEA